MSEIPPASVELLPAAQEVYPDGLIHTRVVDPLTLECSWAGHRSVILHQAMDPKIWSRGGWRRVRRDAYARLFGRVVCGKDVQLRMDPEELPLWLRTAAAGKMAAASILHRGVRRRDHPLHIPQFTVLRDPVDTLGARVSGAFDLVGLGQERGPMWAAKLITPQDFRMGT